MGMEHCTVLRRRRNEVIIELESAHSNMGGDSLSRTSNIQQGMSKSQHIAGKHQAVVALVQFGGSVEAVFGDGG
jgi:hypothetical protein